MGERQVKGMGTVSRRPNGRYQGRIELEPDDTGKRQRKYVYADTEPACWKLLKKLVADQERGKIIKTDERGTVGDYVQRWHNNKRDITDNVRYNYQSHLRHHILPSKLARMALTKVRPTDADDFVTSLYEKKLAISTIRHIMAPLGGAYATAYR
jgi:hypothetical protein